MSARSVLAYVTVALPPLALAAVGVTHPMHLTATSAEYWRNLHIAILPVFPLLAFAPWLVARHAGALVAWIVGVLGFVYAAFYTALDVLAGIGAGGLKLDGMGMATGTVFGLGSHIGEVGSVSFIAASAIAAATAMARVRLAALPGAVLVVVGAVLFLQEHIYFPVGVIGQLCLALGWLWLCVLIERASRDRGPLIEAVDETAVPTV
ncbi:hypothetical protein F1C58_12815 [Glaciihabitans sp. INWT7]|uniref:hypothetical protein n=1 Tax=Glaciihabitans sp. INWT7 TaxID=2596912 RepID=UPI00162A6F14|nr:hypothetical protein [Glaciihabitans sp. INWT7]QNE47694.1 hypothetical protein F1C58_12815 [Glaciihabitans sp. INWT7]